MFAAVQIPHWENLRLFVLKQKSNTILVSKSVEEGIDLVFGCAQPKSFTPSVLQTG